MAHKALYRLWRPKIFEDITGQDPIVKTLKNQIAKEQIGHAYLFTGTRGTGKTSTAKVFAKAVNCEKPSESNPCNTCSTCKGIMEETMMDVIEIDAASNNGVENIREIRENVKYHPSKGKYKVYIIDEVHMLSQGAFNALLKTLEEPPEHVIFILATTEPRKIPATILSRCQRYDFKPVELELIVTRLAYILDEMRIEFDYEALRMIGVSAEGALRDALSILEQTIDWDERKVTKEHVMNTLGIVPDEVLYSLVENLKKGNIDHLLCQVDEGTKDGRDPLTMARDLNVYFRKLLMAKIGLELQQFSTMPKDFLEKLQNQSLRTTRQWIVEQMEALSELEGKLKWSAQPRILFEMYLIGKCYSPLENEHEDMSALDQITKEVTALKEKILEIERNSLNQENKEIISKAPIKPRNETTEIPDKKAEKQVITELPEKEAEENCEPSMTEREVRELWPKVLITLKKERKAQLEALLKEGEIQSVEKDRIMIGYDQMYSFHREALDKEDKKLQITDVIEQLSGKRMTLSLKMKEENVENYETSDLEEELKKIVPEGILEVRDD